MDYIFLHNVIYKIFNITLAYDLIAMIYSFITVNFNILDSFRIQKNKLDFYSHLPLLFFNIFIVRTLLISSMYLFKDFFILDSEPSYSIFFFQIFILFVVDDCYFYWYHYFSHKNKWFYKNIHYLHHKAKTPYALDFIYAHPLEIVLGTLGSFIGILLLNGVYIKSFIIYTHLKLIHEIDVHSGIKSYLSNFFPFIGKTEDHDLHHLKLNGNYASTFTIWDTLCNTRLK